MVSVRVKVILQLRICIVAEYLKLFFSHSMSCSTFVRLSESRSKKDSLQTNTGSALINCNINFHSTCAVTGCKNVADWQNYGSCRSFCSSYTKKLWLPSLFQVTEVLLNGATFVTHKVSKSCSLQQHISSSFCDPGFNNCSAQCISENKVLKEWPLLAEDSSS